MGATTRFNRGHAPTDDDPGFIPALRFDRLTPLFDFVAAVAVRDRALKRRVRKRHACGRRGAPRPT
jgi:pantothenate kinase